ncbi:Single hybrid motif [Pseudocohnilembus persalinus]|uniref:Single hybrid motif n=1 Tax=Pseudocohnilembus persalinus TaxID=266149 RepID=A0A0V0R415_PSEPJ|nr:Single hybrid motif [Pseudocohnilembus persalinus]|eukprot:KRX08952.1 Single hybrid motif [Pseudocohnilembus persalinus]
MLKFEEEKIEEEQKLNQNQYNNNSSWDKKAKETENQNDEQFIDAFHLSRSDNFISRYFQKFYKKYSNQEKQQNLDQYIYQHKNELCIVGLSPYHEIRKNKLKIKSISFDCIYQGDLNDFVSGRLKKKSIQTGSHINIAVITCENGQIFKVKGIINGQIMELNTNLIENPQWIIDHGDDKGYIAIIEINKKKKKHFWEDKFIFKEEDYFKNEVNTSLSNFIDPKQ